VNPWVTCIMPTRGRREMAQISLDCFMAQTYEKKELLVLDDFEDRSFADKPGDESVLYMTNSGSASVGSKRNRCCDVAAGLIILHWDSDDWNAPNRIEDQVERLLASGKSVTGYNTLLFHEEQLKTWGRFHGPTDYGLGTSLCYLKSYWETHRFLDVNVAEDNSFVYGAARENQYVSATDRSIIVARVHAGNTSPKDMGNFRPIDPSEIPAGFH
jgi:glycosyltransferase involved in cell wall biosynthesis